MEEFISASYAFPRQMSFYHTAPLPLCVTWQQNLTEYCQEDSTCAAIQPISASNVMSQHNKTGDIAFGSALIYNF